MLKTQSLYICIFIIIVIVTLFYLCFTWKFPLRLKASYKVVLATMQQNLKMIAFKVNHFSMITKSRFQNEVVVTSLSLDVQAY